VKIEYAALLHPRWSPGFWPQLYHWLPFEPGTVPVGGIAAGVAAYEDDIDVSGTNFAADVLGTSTARYRVQAIQSAQCEKLPWIKTRARGLLGVQSTFIGHAVTGTTLAMTGKMPGRILWRAILF
jgi:hypothetical protein